MKYSTPKALRFPLVVAAALIVLNAEGGLAHRCTGDCDGSDTVAVSELVNGVRIALGQLQLQTCFSFDADLDGRVSINELQVAVNNVFSYCGHGSPPTPTNTRTNTPLPSEPAPSASPTPTASPIA